MSSGKTFTEGRAREIVFERAGFQCEVRIPGVCVGGVTYHHRKLRGQCPKPDLWRPSNALAACGSGTTGCHGWITGHPARAYELGWAQLRTNEDPAKKKAWIWSNNYLGFGWFLLDDRGDLTRLWDVAEPTGVAVGGVLMRNTVGGARYRLVDGTPTDQREARAS
ncbi:hypothetical protein [Amycolatopsis thermophila]|uniref:Uncharacterized protein n=1 Tax=Amycolatopsis thermophila TaxID=206084 RepID=A0ABU0EMV6_9PSEU|nr:hypothetical protein [Amycolatopsis thermophila]MDQ0376624.1 hypothetical protein [Amycolatopsis thermophila]